MIFIKTQSIPLEKTSQFKEAKELPEIAKESFLNAFKEANSKKESTEEKKMEVVDETVDAEEFEDELKELPLLIWKQQPHIEESVSFNEEFSEDIAIAEPQKKHIEELLFTETTETTETMNIRSLMVETNNEMTIPNEDQPIEMKRIFGLSEIKEIEKAQAESSLIKDIKNDLSSAEFAPKTMVNEKGTQGFVPESNENIEPERLFVEKTKNTHSFIEEIGDSKASLGVREDPSSLTDVPKAEKAFIPPRFLYENSQETTNLESFLLRNMKSETVQEISAETHPEDLKIETAIEQVFENETMSIVPNDQNLNTSKIHSGITAKTEVPAEQWTTQVESFILEETGTGQAVDKTVTARLQLTPEKLGEMNIELVIKNKELTANFVVEHYETKEWLEQKLNELTLKLSTQDLQMNDIQVVVEHQKNIFMDLGAQGQGSFKEKQKPHQERKMSAPTEEEQAKSETKNNESTNTRGLSMWV